MQTIDFSKTKYWSAVIKVYVNAKIELLLLNLFQSAKYIVERDLLYLFNKCKKIPTDSARNFVS